MDLTKKFPRAGEMLLGGYPWLARAIDKARAYNEGNLGDYIYPCPIDKELLAELNLTGIEFAEIVEQCETDEEILGYLGIHENNDDPTIHKWAHEFIENRQDSLIRLAEDEGRVYSPPQGVAVTRRFA
jgi:hypothetical protein